METAEFRRELDRRLEIIENPDYNDPGRADLPGRDLLILLLASVLVIVALMSWGYPW